MQQDYTVQVVWLANTVSTAVTLSQLDTVQHLHTAVAHLDAQHSLRFIFRGRILASDRQSLAAYGMRSPHSSSAQPPCSGLHEHAIVHVVRTGSKAEEPPAHDEAQQAGAAFGFERLRETGGACNS